MTIENTDKVDGLGVDAQAQEAVLLISDHLSWHDVGEHFGFLEKKIGSYVSFINSGQLDEALPNAKGLPVRIKLIHEHRPDSRSIEILDGLAGQLSGLGLRFSYEALPSGY